MDKFNTKRLSLGGIKEKMENATQEFNTGYLSFLWYNAFSMSIQDQNH